VIALLSVEQLLEMHEELLEEFGGGSGVRDLGALEAAAARPAASFGGEDLYPDLASKAAALMHSLVMNHPFVDGNKRIGAAAAEFFVNFNGSDLSADDSEMEAVTLATARGEMSAEALAIWFRQRLLPRQV
jgi:death on curing protein